VLNSTFTRSTN